MPRRVALALPRMPLVRPIAVPRVRRPRLGAPSRRTLLTATAVAIALAGSYVGARETSLFALREVDVVGASAAIETEVRSALEPFEGTSLVALDPGKVEARVRAVPAVRDARVDRTFPHGLRIVVGPERELAVIRDGPTAWLIAESGRVIQTIEPAARPRLPRVRAELVRPLRVGGSVPSAEIEAALTILRVVPKRFPVGVLYAEVDGEEAILVLRGGVEIRLGSREDVEPKLRAAAAVLRSLEPEELAEIDYVDVAVPEHVVAGSDPQPESES